jgi:chromosome segregation ATPase
MHLVVANLQDLLPIAANLLRLVGRSVASIFVRVFVLLAAVALPLVLWAVLPTASSGQSSKAQELSELQRRIDRARGQIGRKRGSERVLSTEIARYSRRLDRLEGRITTLGARQGRIQSELDDRRGELERLRTLLRDARARLVRLRLRLTQTQTALRARLIQIYKAPSRTSSP